MKIEIKKLIINIDNLFHKKINSQQELLDRFSKIQNLDNGNCYRN